MNGYLSIQHGQVGKAAFPVQLDIFCTAVKGQILAGSGKTRLHIPEKVTTECDDGGKCDADQHEDAYQLK